MEHVLQGFEKFRPNPNMLDFGVTVMNETYGRERRHRWFTFKGYKTLLNQENISEAEHELSVDLANTGGFTDVAAELFYGTLDQLHQHQDTDAREETTKKKRKPPKNPILPDGTVKRGRPRKNPEGVTKRKKEDLGEEDGVGGQAHPLKRVKISTARGDGVADASQSTPAIESAPRKRGRPPKRKPENEPSATHAPRKRGRPPKNRAPATVEEQEIQDGGGQSMSTITPFSVSVQEVVPGVAHDQAGLPALSYQVTFEQTAQQVAAPETDALQPAGYPQPSPPPERHLSTHELREPVQRSQQDPDGVRTSDHT